MTVHHHDGTPRWYAVFIRFPQFMVLVRLIKTQLLNARNEPIHVVINCDYVKWLKSIRKLQTNSDI